MTRVDRKTDAEIQRDVLEELRWDPRVEETDLDVTVGGGVVTLTGTVTSWARRVAARDAARRVAGVRDVANAITVETPESLDRTDPELADAVRRTLAWDVFVPDDRIVSTVTSGIVTLEGTVETLMQRDAAERALRNLTGVKAVVNKLAVQAPARINEHVAEAIEHALERRAERQARRIRIDVHDGVVTLTGTVHSWAERRSVLGAARSTPGVRAVEDRLWPEP
jgi:osmotically-inducible protein OsmY